jgi:DNA-binding transcriptional ArsR family regulator
MINRKNSFQPSSLSVVAADGCEQRAKIFAALSDPTRLRMVELLNNCDEMSGSEIANHLGISLALFCHHSKILVEARLIQTRKEGQTKYNSLNRQVLLACFASFGELP